MSEFIEFRSKLVTYSKLHGVQFNAYTSDARKGPKGIPGFNELTVLFTCTVSMSCATMVCVTCLSMFWIYYSSKKNRDVHCLHKLSVPGLKKLFINAHPHDIRESVDVLSESGLPGMNGLGLESTLNILNVLNGLVP